MPKKTYRPRTLLGDIPRPPVLRRELAKAMSRAEQLKRLLRISQELEEAESDAHAAVTETSN